MSADNYYQIRYRDGKFYACMGFLSSDYDESGVPITDKTPEFESWAATVEYLNDPDNWTEYGYHTHSECPYPLDDARTLLIEARMWLAGPVDRTDMDQTPVINLVDKIDAYLAANLQKGGETHGFS